MDEYECAVRNTYVLDESEFHRSSEMSSYSHEQYDDLTYFSEHCFEHDPYSFSSLVVHWIPPLPTIASSGISSSPSFMAHYVMSNSLKEKLYENEILSGLKAILNKQEQMSRKCKKS